MPPPPEPCLLRAYSIEPVRRNHFWERFDALFEERIVLAEKWGPPFPHEALSSNQAPAQQEIAHGSGRPDGECSPQPFLALHAIRSAAAARHRLEHRLVRDPRPHGRSARRLDRRGG